MLDYIARAARQYERGIITEQEFATYLSNQFAGDKDLQTTNAAKVVGLIPDATRELVIHQLECALSPNYLRQAFAMGGRRRTKEEDHKAAVRETARERAWAEALRPLL